MDSSTTALLLRKQGHEVQGLSLRLFESRGTGNASHNPAMCCSLEAIADARQSAEAAGIQHHILDARDIFVNKVIEPFASAYVRGITPNPCVLCNQHVKFPLLLQEAQKRGMTHIATGHYATVKSEHGDVALLAGRDSKKDQSYFLYPIGIRILEHLILPLGGYLKDEIRQIARQAGLPVFNRPESQEICFVQDNDYAATVEALFPDAARPGQIIGPGGKALGTHRGTVHYTIGQRRGLAVAWGHPLYVTAMDAATNTVYLGERHEVMRREFTVGDIIWLTSENEARCAGQPFNAHVKMRSTMKAEPATVEPIEGGRAIVRYDEPEFAPAPGQSAVFYHGARVLGGGIIEPQAQNTQ